MESSDSEDEGDGAENLRESQEDRLAREEGFYRFVNNLSEDDYKFMRDNRLLGIPGECTEEELRRRLQLLKEISPQHSDENTGGRNSSDNVSSGHSVTDWLNSVRQNENMTGEQRENQSWGEMNQINPNSEDIRLNLESHIDYNNESPDRTYEIEDTEHSQSQLENSPSESLFTRSSVWEQSTAEASVEVPRSRGLRRPRSRSPNRRRMRPRIASRSPPNILTGIVLDGFPHYLRPWSLRNVSRSETQTSSTTQHQETSRPELQNTSPSATSEMGNLIQEEYSSETFSIGESWGSGQMNTAIDFDPEEGIVQSREIYQEDIIASRSQLTSESPDNAESLENEKGGLSPTFTHFEQDNTIDYDSTNRLSFHRLLSSFCSDTTSVIHETSGQTMTGFSDSSNLTENDSNLEPNISPPTLNTERTESPNGRDGSGNSSSSGINVIPEYYFQSSSPVISNSSSIYVSSSNSTPMSSSSSSDNVSEISSLLFEASDERSIAGLSENTGLSGNRPMTPVMFDESDSWTSLSLDQFFLLEDEHHSTGLTKAQIDNLAVRSFGENDALKSCTICITEFTEGNRIRVLPCHHEFHIHCVDRWLSENTTCPICRGEVVDPAERENSN
ncbi:PREDICTED: E3 ubiquitin-protein ligase RLIM-like [Condylura cristata]|uniref:E3 ubiquitin-protein ligase RLIM-like n=1 Tax=Condylura cristata TaxID=143302 RepID=UPI0003344960|nr:PREDICTED: E3 ubiquitin-protein ligase RLIM-like [Condylura cristata]